ncbi:MAG: beta-ketoacyl-[acyl-carrier-protein] synthase family protein [Chitinophagales bacterium]
MQDKVVITGLGLISALGNNVKECINSFENHRSGVHKINRLQTNHTKLSVAEVKHSNAKLSAIAGISADLSRSILLSYIATKEAVQSLPENFSSNFKTAYISATTVGGMDKTEEFFNEYIDNKDADNIQSIQHHDCGKITDFVAEELGIQGTITTISTACSSSANAIALGTRMIKQNLSDIAIVGGVDALTKFTLNGFNTLQILDTEQCRPLDETRVGLNLGEGAAYLVLMSEKLANELNQEIYCSVTGYHNANDSFHQTALSDDAKGPHLAMQGALKKSGLQPDDIDYINMHGTGTRNNDNAEGIAIQNIFQHKIPKLSSTKSFTGHTLGASGAVEAVFSVLAIKDGIVFPNYTFENPMENLTIFPEKVFLKDQDIKHVMSNSFGFGGNCSSLIFSAN